MFKSILLPVDEEHESSWRRTLPVARHIAQECDAELNILGVVPPFGTTLVVELAGPTGLAYVPTRKAFVEGGYEVINSRLAPGGVLLLSTPEQFTSP